ncbi:MAG: C1 family peptidase [Methanomassiliicoccales archaeon]
MRRFIAIFPLFLLLLSVNSLYALALPPEANLELSACTSDSDRSMISIPGHHLMTEAEMLQLKATLGVRQAGVDYNLIVDGFGTGLAPPTEEEYRAMVGRVWVADAVPLQDLTLPSSYDISKQGFFPKVGNQGSQGSCAAWAAIYYTYGYLEAKDNGWYDVKNGTNSSRLMSPAWAYNKINGGVDQGSWMSENFRVAVDWGVASLATHPYNPTDYVSWGSAAAFREAPLHKAHTYQEWYYKGDAAVAQAKAWLSQDIPVTFALDSRYYVFDNGAFIVTSQEYNSDTLNHAQTLVGYDDSISEDGEVGAFRVVNSWGSDWGDKGYYWLTYEAFKKISNRAGLWMTTVVDIPDYSPSLLATWYFNTPPLRSASITIALGEYPTALKSISPFYEYDTTRPMPAFMCLDISSFLPEWEAGTSSFWIEVQGGGSAQLSSFRMEAYEGVYFPGAATLASGQSASVPRTLPGFASIKFYKYPSVSFSSALDTPGLSFTSHGEARWVAVNHTYYKGGYSAQSGCIPDKAASSLQSVISGASSVSFYWKVSSQSGKDLLRFYVDDGLQGSISGNVEWTKFSISISPTVHVLRWEFVHDEDDCAYADAGWVDAVELVPADDLYEENDAWSEAKPLDVKQRYSGLKALDPDWFKVWLRPGDRLRVRVDFNSSQGDLDLYLFGTDGTHLLGFSATSGGMEIANMTATVQGHHYICVLPDAGTWAQYELSFQFEPGEPDQGRASSLTIVSGAGGFANISATSLVIEVGSRLEGKLLLRASNLWSIDDEVPLVATTSWGDAKTSFWTILNDLGSGVSELETSISLDIPTEPGAYHLLFAYRNESSPALIASATSHLIGMPIWEDGNDLSALSPFQIAQSKAEGRALVDWLMPDGMHLLYLPCAVLTIEAISLDTEPPSTMASLSGTTGQDGWYRSSVMVTLTATDTGGTGVKETWYSVDSGAWASYSSPFEVSGSAVHLVCFYSVDWKGNVEQQRQVMVRIDTTPPTTSAKIEGAQGRDGWYVSSISLSLTTSDSVSGVQYSYYRVNGGIWRIYTTTTIINAEGLILLEYYSVDVAGNGESIKKMNLKADLSPPITTCSIEGEGGPLWYRGPVMVTLSTNDALSGPGPCFYSLNGGAWTPYSAPIVLDKEGEHALSFNATDVAGNEEAAQSLTIRIDATAPTTSYDVEGVEGLAGWFVSPITVRLYAQDALSGVGQTTWSLDGGAWEDYVSPIIVAYSGEHLLRFRSVDLAGNLEEVRELILKMDVSPPMGNLVVVGEIGNEGWYRSDVLIMAEGNDEGSGVAAFYYRFISIEDWSPLPSSLQLQEDGVHRLVWFAVDWAGNQGEERELLIMVDRCPPIASLGISGSQGQEGWFVSLVDLHIDARDETSGVREIYYSLSGQAWRKYSSPITLSDEGVHEMRFFAVDNAGNPGEISSQEIRMDMSAPVTELYITGREGREGWYVSQVEVNLDPGDGVSGIAGTYYRIDGGSWQEAWSSIMIADGRHMLEYFSVDSAGNQERFQAREIMVDSQPPATLAITTGEYGARGWFRSQVTIQLSPSDETSGAAKTFYKLNEEVWREYISPLTLGEGMHLLRFRSVDQAGNEEEQIAMALKIDWTAPQSALRWEGERGAAEWFVSAVNLTLGFEDAVSGIYSAEWRLDGGDWQPYSGVVRINASGHHTLEWRSSDVAGNVQQTRQESFKIDLDKPMLHLMLPNQPFTSKRVQIPFQASDPTSSVALLTVRLDGGEYFTRPLGGEAIDVGELKDGLHELEIIITDEAGNSLREVVLFEVNTNPFSPQGPFGPWPLIGMFGLAVIALLLALPLRRRKM